MAARVWVDLEDADRDLGEGVVGRMAANIWEDTGHIDAKPAVSYSYEDDEGGPEVPGAGGPVPNQQPRPNASTLQQAWRALNCCTLGEFWSWQRAGLRGVPNTVESVLDTFCGDCTIEHRTAMIGEGRCMRVANQREGEVAS